MVFSLWESHSWIILWWKFCGIWVHIKTLSLAIFISWYLKYGTFLPINLWKGQLVYVSHHTHSCFVLFHFCLWTDVLNLRVSAVLILASNRSSALYPNKCKFSSHWHFCIMEEYSKCFGSSSSSNCLVVGFKFVCHVSHSFPHYVNNKCCS